MISSIIFCVLFMFVVCSMAAPINEEIVLDPDLTPLDILKHKHRATKLEKAALSSARKDRQFGYPYPSYPYDYYSYPVSYYNQYPYDTSYEQPQTYYPYPPPAPQVPVAPLYALTHSHTRQPPRRVYRPNQRAEATSQKYSVWDLARK